MPAPLITNKSPGQTAQDMSVILVTGSYDHEIRFWEAWSGICSRTITRSGESGVRSLFLSELRADLGDLCLASKSSSHFTRVSHTHPLDNPHLRSSRSFQQTPPRGCNSQKGQHLRGRKLFFHSSTPFIRSRESHHIPSHPSSVVDYV